ncbi:hypothetical protein BHE74_00052177 [Ensete ventricosum]|nr:hypothetical protein GW17_00028868 [Ensete ventricosum]RWW42290.1 hypothetical protein BHE74_00052177 [Ensete ventricosum]RZR93758.1 hypothetical protein BHM03_00022331 [Ensete ventricosum]
MPPTRDDRREKRRRLGFFCLLTVVYTILVCLACGCSAVATPVLGPRIGAEGAQEKTTLIGRRPTPPETTSSVHESKRRVPTCPDPLHNK